MDEKPGIKASHLLLLFCGLFYVCGAHRISCMLVCGGAPRTCGWNICDPSDGMCENDTNLRCLMFGETEKRKHAFDCPTEIQANS